MMKIKVGLADDNPKLLQAIKKGLSETTTPAFNFTYTVPAVVVKDTFIRVHSKKGLLFTGPPIYALDCLYLI